MTFSHATTRRPARETSKDPPLVLGREANLIWRELAPLSARVDCLLNRFCRRIALTLTVGMIEGSARVLALRGLVARRRRVALQEKEGTSVGDPAPDCVAVTQGSWGTDLGETVVDEDAELLPAVVQEVGRLDVAMYDAPSMRRPEGAKHVAQVAFEVVG